MSTTVPAKIVLKSTTKVTLSERFTQIQKMRPPPPSTQEVRVQMASQAHASQQNRRLAQQMANRPAVQAALGSRQQLAQLPQQNKFQKKSLKQRLGPSNVKARLSLNNAPRGAPAQRRGGRGGRVMNGFNNRGGQVRGGRGGRGNRGAGRGSPRWRDQNDYHPRGRGGFGRPGNQYVWRDQDDYHPRGRGGFGRPGNRYVGRGGGGGRGRGNSPGFRGQRGGRGGPRGRGGRGGRGRGGENFTREQLDNQLEEYMSKTKYSLNAELDEYMANADN